MDVAGAAGVVEAAFPPRILNMTVPQVGHLPLIALRPFFIVSSIALAISFLALHLTQYPSAIENVSSKRFMCPATSISLRFSGTRRNL